MQALELRIPPPAVALLVAGTMWGISLVAPLLEVPAFIRMAAAAAIALAGGGFSLAGVISFRRAKTTVNPMKPETASSLVCSGIYRITRNPMYVVQIEPEERVLSAVFGTGYADYRSGVRRWL